MAPRANKAIIYQDLHPSSVALIGAKVSAISRLAINVAKARKPQKSKESALLGPLFVAQASKRKLREGQWDHDPKNPLQVRNCAK